MKTRVPRSLFRSRARIGVSGPSDPLETPDGYRVYMSDRTVARLLAAERKIGRCVLCKAPAAHAPVWVTTPDESRRLGAGDGEARIIIVGLCAACRALPRVFERVEKKMFAEAAENLAKPEAN